MSPTQRTLTWRVAVIGMTVTGHLIRTVLRQRGRGLRTATAWSAAVPGLLVALGPSFVKIGQILGTRRDLLPETWCGALATLSDEVPPPPRAALHASLCAVYGQPAAWPFREIDWEPVASGSIATVHRAVLRDGHTVALKIRRPGIAPVMAADLALLLWVARLAERLPRLRRTPLSDMAGQVGSAILRQLDFEAERQSLHALRRNLREHPEVCIPAPIDEWCGPTTLVMEYLTDLRRSDPATLSPAARQEFVRNLLTAVYRMLFVDGLVHCDLHPGNVYPHPDGSLTMLDGGFVVELSEHARRLFAEFFVGMALTRGGHCADVVLRSARGVGVDCDVVGFRKAVADLVNGAAGASADDFNLAIFAGRLFDIQRRYGIYAAPEFAFPLMSLLVVEGMVNDFDPGVDFQALALPILSNGAGRRNRIPAAA